MTEELRRKPVQERSQNRVTAIRDAALAVIQEKGRDRFTTYDVAQGAKCSIGTVYRYFPDRVAILDDLFPDRNKAQEILDKIQEHLDIEAEKGKFTINADDLAWILTNGAE